MATMNQVGVALSGASGTGSFAGTTSATLVTPRVAQINDASGNPMFALDPVGSADYWTFSNAGALGSINARATGSDTNIDMIFNTKGTGQLKIAAWNATQPIIINSGTSGQRVTTFAFANTSASYVYTFPDASGTLLYSGGPLGTPSSGTLSSCSGLPVSTGISGLGTGIATWLATPSSANLAAAVTDETGTGALLFATDPTITNSATISRPGGGTAFTISSTLSSVSFSLDVDSTNQISLNYNGGSRGFVLNTANSKAEIWAQGGKIITFRNGLDVGGATGGDKGTGTANFSADIYKNNTAYNNPDYVIEKWVTGEIEKFKDNEGAKDYQLKSLDEVESVMRQTLKLPGAHNEPMGSFARQDWLLEKMEEAFIYIIELKKEIEALKREK